MSSQVQLKLAGLQRRLSELLDQIGSDQISVAPLAEGLMLRSVLGSTVSFMLTAAVLCSLVCLLKDQLLLHVCWLC